MRVLCACAVRDDTVGLVLVLSVRLFGVVTQPQVPVSSGAALQLPQAIPAGQRALEERVQGAKANNSFRTIAFTAPGMGDGWPRWSLHVDRSYKTNSALSPGRGGTEQTQQTQGNARRYVQL